MTLPGPDNTTYRNELQHVIDSLHPDIITCYTDGSGTDQGRGVGLIITTNKNNTIIHRNSYKIPDYCTVFQAELTAIKVTCEYLYDHSNKHIIIWTDNLSSIQAVTALNIKSRTVRDCSDALNKLGNSSTVELRWIKQLTLTFGVMNKQMS